MARKRQRDLELWLYLAHYGKLGWNGEDAAGRTSGKCFLFQEGECDVTDVARNIAPIQSGASVFVVGARTAPGRREGRQTSTSVDRWPWAARMRGNHWNQSRAWALGNAWAMQFRGSIGEEEASAVSCFPSFGEGTRRERCVGDPIPSPERFWLKVGGTRESVTAKKKKKDTITPSSTRRLA